MVYLKFHESRESRRIRAMKKKHQIDKCRPLHL